MDCEKTPDPNGTTPMALSDPNGTLPMALSQWHY